MKHILSVLTIALLSATAPLFAAPAFTDPVFNGVSFNTATPYTNQNEQGVGNGSYYTIRFNGSGDFYLTNKVASLYGNDEYLTQSIYGITHYGFIDSNNVIHEFSINDPNNIVSFTSQSDEKAGTTYTVNREGYFLGHFDAGDEIQIYLAQKSGNTVLASVATNTPQQGVHSTGYGTIADGFNSALTLGQLYFPGEGMPQMNFGIVASGQNYVAGGDTFGAPLPGGLSIALVSGLFALGFWYIRRRKAIAA